MQQLTKFLPYILGGIGVLIAAIAASVFLIVKSSRKKQDPAKMFSAAMKQRSHLEEQFHKYRESVPEKAGAAAEPGRVATPPPPPRKPGLWHRLLSFFGIHSGPLGHSFKEALKLLREKIPGRDFRYRVPWYVMMGESASGKTTLLDNVGLPQPFGRVGGDPFLLRKTVTWWLFTTGVVLDVDGNMVSSPDGKTSDDSTWREF